MSRKVYRGIIIILIIAILLFLNIQKYSGQNEELLSVWSSYDYNYYNQRIESGLLDRFREVFHPERLIYGVSKIRIRAPITYLKSEIPLLAYYTPEELQAESETIYTPENLIQLQFDIIDEDGDGKQINLRDDDEKITETKEIEESIEKQERDYISTAKQPVIAIYHSHTAETYIDDPRIQDANGRVLPGNIGNVGKVGMELSRILSEEYGFKVIHTTKVHDEVYSRSYYNSRNTVKELLEKHSQIDLILDIHRDSIRNYIEGTYTTNINDERVARIMIIVTNEAFSFDQFDDVAFERSNWQQNLNLANSMADQMEFMYPGLLQRITVRDTTANRYNQDLHPHSLLLEIGDYNNTTQEAIRSARYLAEVIANMF
ncbi:stage II sporulation protein P [Natronospora cellulosivora (SeqCode)]